VVAVSTPGGVSASPSSISFTGCGNPNTRSVTFSATRQGQHSITHTVTSGQGVNKAADANFTLTVNPATTTPINNTPTLNLPTGIVAEGNTVGGAIVSYTATASDAEDGPVLPADCNPASGTFFALGGPHTVSCSYTDSGGLTATGTFTVTVVDTTAPTLLVPEAVTAEATGPAGAAVSWEAEALDVVDPAPEVDCDADSDSTYELGTTLVECTATDASGNITIRTFPVTVSDTTAPTLVQVPADFSVEATDATGAEVTYQRPSADDLVDGDPVVWCDPDSGTWFAMGDTVVTCHAADASGNPAVPVAFTVTVEDTTAPTLVVPADFNVEATSAAGASVPFTVVATDAVDPNPVVRCVTGPGSAAVTSPTGFGLGAHTVTCTATDATGNSSSPASFTVRVRDTTAPVLDGLPEDIVAEAASPAGAVVTYATPSASDAVDADPVVECLPASGATFPVGSTRVSCTATDAACNKSDPARFTVTVEDTTAPEFSGIPADIVAEATSSAGATITYQPPTAHDLVDGDVAVDCTPAPGSTLGVGDHTVDCIASDTAGNTAQASFGVTVRDTTAPAFSGVPDDIVTEASGPDGAVVAFDLPTADDIVDGSTNVDCSAAPGDTFPLGTTTVRCDTVDRAGNENAASFTITVQDTTAPVLSNLPADFEVMALNGNGTVVNFDAPTAFDTVDGVRPVSCTPASGSTLGVGIHTVTCTAADRSKNTATAHFTVTVSAPTTTGLRPPITTNGNRSAFRLNSTIPVKIAFTGAATGITNAELTVSVRKLDTAATGGELENGTTATPTPGVLMRHDAGENQYIYNLATKPLGAGRFEITVSMGSVVLDRAEINITR
jgi:hypothetical protein